MTLAYKFEIGSDDDELTVEQVRALPQVEVSIDSMFQIPFIGFYEEHHNTFEIYCEDVDSEIYYFVERK